ncbi:MAG: Coq4 family protein [Polyangiaceae bacterium]
MLDLIERPVRAARALSALLRNPDDTKQVFTLVEALSSGPDRKFVAKMASTRSGQRLLEGKPDLFARLGDREALARLPEGSLGRAYLEFMATGRLDAGFLVRASAQGGLAHEGDAEDDYVGRRLRDQHDLWHVVTGYRGDLLGEASVLAFTFAQTWNVGIGVIVAAAFATTKDPDAHRMFLDAFARGVRAAWLPAVEWEELLELPLEEVRARLRVGPPVVYEPFWSSELPEGGVIGAMKADGGGAPAPAAQAGPAARAGMGRRSVSACAAASASS